jgi:hypothetical protein
MISSGVSAEKTATHLTINISPENPSNLSFHITGFLTDSTGKSLGNKRVTLESSYFSADDSDDFSFIAVKETERDGKYTFFRPADTPPEFLIVRFAGNDEYERTASPVLPVRGIGTDNPQIRSGRTGSITISTTPQEADIFIDDEYYGVSYKRIPGLAEGSHNVTISKKGYPNQTVEAYVTTTRDAYFEVTL